MRTRSLVLFLLVLVVPVAVFSQRTLASLQGTVTSPDGQALPGVTVVINNAKNGFERTAITGSNGAFSFPNLVVGTYDLSASLDGFQSKEIEGVVLNVADNRSMSFAMDVGTLVDVVTVSADAVSLETVGGEVAGVITGDQVRELPLNGRNFVQLAQLMPGVSAPEGLDTKNKGLLGGVDLSVSGGSTTSNLWSVDGANNNDVGSNRTILVYPAAESIEQFKIHRNSYGAEFGQSGGAQINLVTKSGTNRFHGSAFYFNRDASLSETNYFLEQANLAKEPLKRDDFGFTLGGPVVRDKLHFFWSEEWNDEARGVVRTGFVPTAAERVGDFSGARIAGCSPAIPVDPLTGQPFPGNQIPADRLSDAGLAYLNLFPQPNVNPTGGSCNNYVDAPATPIEWRQDSLRLDATPNDRTQVMLRYTQDSWENGSPNAGASNGLWGDDPFPVVDSSWDQPARSVVTQLTNTLGANSVNSLRFSYSGNEIDIARGGTNPGLNGEINSLIPTVFGGKTGGADRSHPVFWGGQGYQALWNIAPWQNKQDLLVLKNDYEQVFGDHWLRAGILYGEGKKDEFIGGASAFESPQFWGAAGINGWGATSGNVLADFLIDDMTFGFSENSFEPFPELEWTDIELYVADSWSITDRVTLDYGIRYSRYELPSAADSRITSFDPASFDPALGNDPCNGLLEVPGTSGCQAAGFLGGRPGPNSALVETDDDNFAPRLGLAWDLKGDGRTVVRAGAGQFFQRERVNVILEMAGNPPYAFSQSGIRKLDDANEPCGGCFSVGAGAPRNGFDKNAETPYNLQYNLSWEQRIGRNSSFEVGYVGSRGKHLMRRSDINYVSTGDGDGNGVSDRLDYIRAGANNPGRFRQYSVFGDATILYWENNGSSEYHSLQTQFRSTFGRGSQFQASYTYANFKADDPLNDSGAGTFAGQVIDPENSRLDWGYAGLHRDHVFNASLVLNLPTLDNKGGFVRGLFGNWEIASIVNYASGQALNVTVGGAPGLGGGVSGTGFANNQRPNRVPGQPCKASGGPGEQWLNPNAFTLDGFQLGSIGDYERGSCEGPEFFQVDLSFYKNIRVTDSVRMQVRFEVFNVFNRDNFIAVDTALNPSSITLDAPVDQATTITGFTPSGSFGRAIATRDPRQVQLGLRLIF